MSIEGLKSSRTLSAALVRFSLNQSVLFNLIFMGLVIFGALFIVSKLPVERYPNINFGEIQINTDYPGATPEEVERLVTQRIEDSLRGMENIDFIRSSSMTGRSVMTVKFEDDEDYETLYDELRIRVLGIQGTLPELDGEKLNPTFNKINVDEWLPVININLISKNEEQVLPRRTLILLAKELRTQLELAEGIKEIKLTGEVPEQYIIAIKPEKINQYGLTISDLKTAIQSNGHSIPAGRSKLSDREVIVRIDQRYRSSEDILNLVVRTEQDGTPLKLKELIDPDKTGLREIDDTIFLSVNGRDAVSCKVLKKDNGNAQSIKDEVMKICASFMETHQDDQIEIHTSLDSTVKINDGLGVLKNSLILSLILVMMTLFFFLSHASRMTGLIVAVVGIIASITVIAIQGNNYVQFSALAAIGLIVFLTCRMAILTVTGIAFSFLGAMILFYYLGYSINEITLLGFVLTCGIIVDDAIVVLENIQRHRELGKSIYDAAIDGTSEVLLPVTSATLTTCAAFLPMLIMSGSVGQFFSLIPISVAAALLISLFECFLLLPLHVVDLDRMFPEDDQQKQEQKNKLVEKLTKAYDKLLTWNLHHPFACLSIVFFLFVLASGVIAQSLFAHKMDMKPLLIMKFFPDDSSVLEIRLAMPTGTPIRETEIKAKAIAKEMRELGEGSISTVNCLTGITIDDAYRVVFGRHYAYIQAELPPREKRTFIEPLAHIESIAERLEKKFEKDGVSLEVGAQRDGPPIGEPVNIRVTGSDDAAVVRLSEAIYQLIYKQSREKKQALYGVTDLRHERQEFEQITQFKFNPSQVNRAGIPMIQSQEFLATFFEGLYVGEYRRTDEDIPIRLRIGGDKEQSINNIPITQNAAGQRYTFSDLGFLRSEEIPLALIRRDFERTVTVTAKLKSETRLDPSVVNAVVKAWYQINKENYPGASIAFGGESESTKKSYESLGIAFIIAVFLIYLILAVQFNSYTQPFIILSNIIFSFIGVALMMGIIGLLQMFLPEGSIRSERVMFTVQSFIAIIGLTGLVINDAIVLIDFINRHRKENPDLIQALLQAGHNRVRPILMTTCTTLAGLLPLAIGIPDFSITWGPYATCFAAGLMMSTVMTLLVVPVLFKILHEWTH